MQDRASPTDEALAKAHARLLKDGSLQFDRVGFERPDIKPPGWLHWIGDALQFVAPALKWVFRVGLALVAGLIVYAIVREILRMRAPPAKPKKPKIVAEAMQAQVSRDLVRNTCRPSSRNYCLRPPQVETDEGYRFGNEIP